MKTMALAICAALAASAAGAQHEEKAGIEAQARATLAFADATTIYRCIDSDKPVYFAFANDRDEAPRALLGFGPDAELKHSRSMITVIERRKVTVISRKEFTVITNEGSRSGPCSNMSEELMVLLLNMLAETD